MQWSKSLAILLIFCCTYNMRGTNKFGIVMRTALTKLGTGWDLRYGQTGLEKIISTQMGHLQISIDHYIDRMYGEHAANKLAHSLLTQLCSYWNAFCKWVGSDYAKFTNMSGCTSTEGWILVPSCVYVMFEEL